mmetsp:Transcript_74293/g.145129  ORF Transcript_74293/g.145129 Transcript_74293/m.145129 type:complete len:249 (+) Transcript_74293:80-826(+)
MMLSKQLLIAIGVTAIAFCNGFTNSRSARPMRVKATAAKSDSLASSPNLSVDSNFVVVDDPEPSAAELTNANMLRIILSVATDQQVNELVWKCLGYRRVPSTRTGPKNTESSVEWDSSKCFPKWREKYPQPPDVIGVTRIYSKEVDGPSMKANQALVRSVPMEYKQGIRDQLRPEGFNGFSLDELTPNKTRRAQCANWLLYYREALFGVSLKEIVRRKELQRNVEAENYELRKKGESIKTAGPENERR